MTAFALSLLPSQCEVCRSWSRGALCADCQARYARPRPACARCGLRLGLDAAACGACLREPPPYATTVCAADYGFPWVGLIAALKFQGRVELAPVLARQLAGAVVARGAALPQRVLPVPLSAARLAERGYNQAWELARGAARVLGLPADTGLLQRPLDTPHQTGLARAERQRNLRGAFMVVPDKRPALQGAHLALVDDVMTTGATLAEAARVLLRGGAARVDLWVLARTPEPG
jgi:ComF family protein